MIYANKSERYIFQFIIRQLFIIIIYIFFFVLPVIQSFQRLRIWFSSTIFLYSFLLFINFFLLFFCIPLFCVNTDEDLFPIAIFFFVVKFTYLHLISNFVIKNEYIIYFILFLCVYGGGGIVKAWEGWERNSCYFIKWGRK